MRNFPWKLLLCGLCAGSVTGLFGAGGGMVLVPMLRQLTDLEDTQVFPASVCIILPVCGVALLRLGLSAPLPFRSALPYLAGSVLGGIAAGTLNDKIPAKWLHRALGALILWGGFRYLWS